MLKTILKAGVKAGLFIIIAFFLLHLFMILIFIFKNRDGEKRESEPVAIALVNDLDIAVEIIEKAAATEDYNVSITFSDETIINISHNGGYSDPRIIEPNKGCELVYFRGSFDDSIIYKGMEPQSIINLYKEIEEGNIEITYHFLDAVFEDIIVRDLNKNVLADIEDFRVDFVREQREVQYGNGLRTEIYYLIYLSDIAVSQDTISADLNAEETEIREETANGESSAD